ncbi:HlyD family secretion protein [Alginatibacterium sediminis]|uniref:HlyD family secretion protein n=1 Tax=Alginatibacterium sediminis TaxID=2164068 RepID=A0A420E688_9ALTE|nr:HlyD family secretion protein [Alginatibacterium sediminis]RKF13210.1 HlyD family secretion protein [Alginatibacterium sediminis]
MDLLLILTYTGICIAIFKIFNIPLNKWTVPTAILGGIVLIGALLVIMNYNHPFSANARQAFVSIPIMPAVRGMVVDVPVEVESKYEKGETLFQIDPRPYQAIVDQKQAQLATAINEVPQLEADWFAAKARSESTEADRDRAKQSYERYETGRKKGGANSPFSELEVENRKQLFLSAEASLANSKAQERSAELAFKSNINGENTQVAILRAELDKALFDLEQTTVKAPVDGIVAQLTLRRGMMAVPAPLRPVISFVPSEDPVIIGAFWENSLNRLKEGDEAEFIVTALPGKVFKGKVKRIIPTISEGEYQAHGNLIGTSKLFMHSRAIVSITPDPEFAEYDFPLGISAQVAIYTEHFHHVSIIRKILLRMQGWVNYLFPFH